MAQTGYVKPPGVALATGEALPRRLRHRRNFKTGVGVIKRVNVWFSSAYWLRTAENELIQHAADNVLCLSSKSLSCRVDEKGTYVSQETQ
jgi:hypothetical protein